jgi:hypothetical protein
VGAGVLRPLIGARGLCVEERSGEAELARLAVLAELAWLLAPHPCDLIRRDARTDRHPALLAFLAPTPTPPYFWK